MIPLGILGTLSGGAAAGAYELISTTVLSSSTATVSFSSIVNTYKHLEIRATLRTAKTASNADSFDVRFNSDSGNNYAYHGLRGNGSSVSSSANSSQNTMRFSFIPSSTDTANSYSGLVMSVLDYTNTSKNTTIRNLFGNHSTNANLSNIALSSGFWNNTSAVSTITFLNPGGEGFLSGSRFSLYGILG